MPFEIICLLAVVALLVFTLFLVFLSRYRKCPSDRIMVIYGKVGTAPHAHPSVFTVVLRLFGRSFSPINTLT